MSETAMVQKPRGRPPKAGMPRDKAGRIDWWAVREEAWRIGAWNAWRDKAIAFGMDPRLATQRGKLFFLKDLTEIEFEAANRWSDMLAKRDRVILSMRRSPKPPALEQVSPGESAEGDPDVIERFKATFAAAHQSLLSGGKIVEAAVNRLCRDEASGMLTESKRGLQLLALHFGLVGKGRKR